MPGAALPWLSRRALDWWYIAKPTLIISAARMTMHYYEGNYYGGQPMHAFMHTSSAYRRRLWLSSFKQMKSIWRAPIAPASWQCWAFGVCLIISPQLKLYMSWSQPINVSNERRMKISFQTSTIGRAELRRRWRDRPGMGGATFQIEERPLRLIERNAGTW